MKQKPEKYIVFVSWYIETRSDTTQTALMGSDIKDHVSGESFEMECLNKDGESIGSKPLTEIDEYLKNFFIEQRNLKGYAFNIYRQEDSDLPCLDFEWPASRPALKLKFAGLERSKKGDRLVGAIKGSSFRRRPNHKKVKRRKPWLE